MTLETIGTPTITLFASKLKHIMHSSYQSVKLNPSLETISELRQDTLFVKKLIRNGFNIATAIDRVHVILCSVQLMAVIPSECKKYIPNERMQDHVNSPGRPI